MFWTSFQMPLLVRTISDWHLRWRVKKVMYLTHIPSFLWKASIFTNHFRLGAIWTKAPINFEWWEADITFRITGRGRIGADGMVCLFYRLFCHQSCIVISSMKLFRHFGTLPIQVIMMEPYSVAPTNGLAWEYFSIRLITIISTIIRISWPWWTMVQRFSIIRSKWTINR